MATEFSNTVIKIIKKIPKGKVATYGQIARLAGKPHGARAVVWILHSCSKSHKLPWQRVINAKGLIPFPWTSRNFTKQKQLLLKEGIVFENNNAIDLKKFQWKKKAL